MNLLCIKKATAYTTNAHLTSLKLAAYSIPSADGVKKTELTGPGCTVRLQAFGTELDAGKWGREN